MSPSVLFAPHNDDESLFAFYQLKLHQPLVIVVLRSYKQLVTENGPHFDIRENETSIVCAKLGLEYIQWTYSDLTPPWESISDAIAEVIARDDWEFVIAPACEIGGHEHHNAVGSIVGGLANPDALIRYLTYRRGYGRSTEGVPVQHPPEWELEKLEVLEQCYPSQLAQSGAAWFPGGEYHTLQEWLA